MSTLPTRAERIRLAGLAGINEQYLYQCMTHRRDMDAVEAARVEEATGKAVRRWQLRRDWHKVWPELVGADGAPKAPRNAKQASPKAKGVPSVAPVASEGDAARSPDDASAEALERALRVRESAATPRRRASDRQRGRVEFGGGR